MVTGKGGGDETPHQHFRAPDAMWEAFSTVCRQQDRTAAADLIAHMTATIRLHGGENEKLLLAEAEDELRTRRARKGGRPRKSPGGAS